MTVPRTVIGVDVAKRWIDVHHLATGRAERVETTPAALRRFARGAKGARVVLEASGGYERPLLEALRRAGVETCRVNPARARHFAIADGRLAKTDRVDAEILARMGASMSLVPEPEPDPARERLAELVARRDDLVVALGRETCRAQQAREAVVKRSIARVAKLLAAQRAAIEAEIARHVSAEPALAEGRRRLLAAPGVGPAVAAVLLAKLPELGRLDRRAIAHLAGLAPHAADSGLRRGVRRIRGGRAEVRRALFLAAFVAGRHDPRIRAFRDRLAAAGKPRKQVVVACARKLLTILNAMVRDQTDYRTATA